MMGAGLLMALTIAGAVLAVQQRTIVHAIFGLAVALAGVALAFLALGSPFVAAMQVLIYIGGITVAMVFAVMLSSAGIKEQREGVPRRLAAALVALLFFAGVALVIRGTEFGPTPETTPEQWSLQAMGRGLLDRFNVVFEALSVVLLLAILGAVAIARRHDEHDDPAIGADTDAVQGGRA